MSDAVRSLTPADIDRIIMMAWEDRTSFDAIREQFGLSPGDVIKLMRREMKASSFKMWRQRTQGRVTKHEAHFAKAIAGTPFGGFEPNRNEASCDGEDQTRSHQALWSLRRDERRALSRADRGDRRLDLSFAPRALRKSRQAIHTTSTAELGRVRSATDSNVELSHPANLSPWLEDAWRFRRASRLASNQAGTHSTKKCSPAGF